MDSREIADLIEYEIENVIKQGYNRLYMNVDDCGNGCGFLRVLAMIGPKYIIVFDGIFPLTVCYEVLSLLKMSQYEIKDFTTGGDKL